MLQDIKDEWVKALRSGKYLQGKKYLRKSNGEDAFCCLGVLQDLVGPEKWERRATDPPGVWAANGWAGSLSQLFLKEVGLAGYESAALVELNDGRELSNPESPDFVADRDFTFIATYIEENL